MWKSITAKPERNIRREMMPESRLPVFSFDEKTGVYHIAFPGFSLRNCRIHAAADGKTVDFRVWKQTGKKDAEFSCVTPEGKWLLKAVTGKDQITLQLSCKLKKACEHLQFFYFQDAAVSLPDHILNIGMDADTHSTSILTENAKPGLECKGHLSILTKGKDQLSLSSPQHPEHVLSFSGRITGKKTKKLTFSAGSTIDHYSPREIRLAPLEFRSGDGFELLSSYGKENIQEKKNFTNFAPGWNSWDYYRWTVTEDAVMENAEFIASDPVLSKYVKKIIIDDGWQYAYGEWEANSLFPSGMEKIAAKLTKMGFLPGLWICPGIVEPFARIAQWDPDMLAKSEDGVPAMKFNCMKRCGFLLDPTVEKVRQFWRDLFEKYCARKFRYFKLDFLTAVMNAPQFADKTVPRGHILDLMLGTIRETVGNRAEIMACGYPMICGNRYMDAVRVGGDIHAAWGAVQANTPSVASVYWANHLQWVNDPDFALCRGQETSDDPDLQRLRPCLVYNKWEGGNPPVWNSWNLADNRKAELETLLSIVIAAGGARNLSDRMVRLNKAGLDLARRTVSAVPGEAAKPLDLFSSDGNPSLWLQKTGKDFRILMINWTDTPGEYVFDLEKQGIHTVKVFDFWHDREVPVRNGKIRKELAPHSCLFAVCKP